MRTDVLAYDSIDLKRTDPTVLVYPEATLTEIVMGEYEEVWDLSAYVGVCRHSAAEATARFHWHSGFLEKQPRPGMLMRLMVDDNVVFTGIVESISQYHEERGERFMEMTCRRPDGGGLARRERITTPTYPTGGDYGQIAADLAEVIWGPPATFDLPPTGYNVKVISLGFTEMTFWEILKELLLPSGQEPMVDALGMLRAISRDVTRESTVVLSDDRVVSIEGSKNSSPISAVLLTWNDPHFTPVIQRDQVLARRVMTAGFFQRFVTEKIQFSRDERQRSTIDPANTVGEANFENPEDTDRKKFAPTSYMVIKKSCNGGLLPVAEERYEHSLHFIGDPDAEEWGYDDFVPHGIISLETHAWVPALATASLATLYAYSGEPDIAPSSGGPTIPTGKLLHGAAEIAILAIMMSIGTGTYEIRGQPYDWVHARNRTQAYNKKASKFGWRTVDIESQLIHDEPHAQDVATKELLYRSAEAQTWGARIVDDPRLEIGDIVELPDKSRIYITDYRRELTRGEPAVLHLEGFRS